MFAVVLLRAIFVDVLGSTFTREPLPQEQRRGSSMRERKVAYGMGCSSGQSGVTFGYVLLDALQVSVQRRDVDRAIIERKGGGHGQLDVFGTHTVIR